MEIPGVEVDERRDRAGRDAVDAALRAATLMTGDAYLSEGWAALGLKGLADEGRYPAVAAPRCWRGGTRCHCGRSPTSTTRCRAPSPAAASGRRSRSPRRRDQARRRDRARRDAHGSFRLDVAVARQDDRDRARRAGAPRQGLEAAGAGPGHRPDAAAPRRRRLGEHAENAWALVALATYRHEIEGGDDDDAVAVTADLGGARLIEAELCDEHDPATRRCRCAICSGGSAPNPRRRSRHGDGRSAGVLHCPPRGAAAGRRPAGGEPWDHGDAALRDAARQHVDAGDDRHCRRRGPRHADDQERRAAIPGRPRAIRCRPGSRRSMPSCPRPRQRSAPMHRPGGTSSTTSSGATSRLDASRQCCQSSKRPSNPTARASTVGTFFAAPPHARLMYEPEVSGSGTGRTITIRPAP